MLNNIKIESIDEDLSMLIKQEPSNDYNVGWASNQGGSSARQTASKSPESVYTQADTASSELDNQTGNKVTSDSVQQTTECSKSPVVNKQAGSSSSVYTTENESINNCLSPTNEQASLNLQAMSCKSVAMNTDVNIQFGECSFKPIVVSQLDAALISESQANKAATPSQGSPVNRVITLSQGSQANKAVTPVQGSQVIKGITPSQEVSQVNKAISTQSARPQLTLNKTTSHSIPPSNKRSAPSTDVRVAENYQKSSNENIVAMQSMLHDLKARLVSLTLELVISPNSPDLTDALYATEKKINFLKRSLRCLKNDAPVSVVDENFKKLCSAMKLVPYFQWEGNVTNQKEKVFLTLYACLRQVEIAVKDYDFDIDTKWVSLISTKLSSQMQQWLDNLLIRHPQLTWPAFKKFLVQEYEMPSAQARGMLAAANWVEEVQPINAFVKRFLMAFEYSKVSEEEGAQYFLSALPTMENRTNFLILCNSVKRNHPNDKHNLYRAIELFRDIQNQTSKSNNFLQQREQREQKVHCVQEVQEVKPERKPKRRHPKPAPYNKIRLRCLYHPKANSHITEDCRNLQA